LVRKKVQDTTSNTVKEYCLLKDKFTIIRDQEIIDLLDNINLEETFLDKNLNDDFPPDKNYIKNTNPFVWLILNTWWPIVENKYLSPYFPDKQIVLKDLALNQGHTPGNILWHSDKKDSDGYAVYNDTDIICLYYLNTLEVGSLQLKYSKTEEVISILPKKGNMIIINEINSDLVHRIEPFDKEKYFRCVARIGFKLI